MKVIVSFSLFSVMSIFALEYLQIIIANNFIYTILFFLFLAVQIEIFTKIFFKRKIDTFNTAFALNVGYKFLFSMVFIFLMYQFKKFEGPADILFFIFNYFIYTYLIAKFGTNKLI